MYLLQPFKLTTRAQFVVTIFRWENEKRVVSVAQQKSELIMNKAGFHSQNCRGQGPD